jgi:hypothetical protein
MLDAEVIDEGPSVTPAPTDLQMDRLQPGSEDSLRPALVSPFSNIPISLHRNTGNTSPMFRGSGVKPRDQCRRIGAHETAGISPWNIRQSARPPF